MELREQKVFQISPHISETRNREKEKGNPRFLLLNVRQINRRLDININRLREL